MDAPSEIRFKADLHADVLMPDETHLLPDHIKENPTPGHWIHVWGVDASGREVNYWSSVEDEEGRESLGRRICSAATARVP